MNWYKTYTGAYDGSSWISAECSLPTPDYFRAVAINARLLDLAAKSGTQGIIATPTGTPYTVETASRVLRLQTGDVAAAIADLCRIGILAVNDAGAYYYANWSKYQQATPSALDDGERKEYNRQKTARSRERKAAAGEAEKLFNEWWELYPRHEARQPALKAWMKIANATGDAKVDLTAVIEATETLLATPSYVPFHSEKKYTPLAATWLNGRRFEDVISA